MKAGPPHYSSGLLGLPHETLILWIWKEPVALDERYSERLFPRSSGILSTDQGNDLKAFLIKHPIWFLIPALPLIMAIFPLPEPRKEDSDALDGQPIPGREMRRTILFPEGFIHTGPA